ncbi:MAG: hypothetical protein KDA70_19965 [Planctomycetaceae bacterium]|nr:hypothetical protein [Planctomycetaceae bacterium]
MTSIELKYPEPHLLWPGAILGSIAHALIVARYPDLAHEQSWDENNYCVQDSAGSRGTVAFSEKRFVAVFFSENSVRNPFNSNIPYDIQRFLAGLPDELATLAHQEALQYVLQEYDGTASPVITSAFWGDAKQAEVGAAEAWEDVFQNGAFLIKNQMLPQDEALAAWHSEYELSDEETAFVKSLFLRKLSQPQTQLVLTTSELSLLKSLSQDEQGLEASRESFLEINISL